ncbi:MAG: hypothetical protein SPJ28_05135, partial [Oscillospiraceae bacterium]|nr:hypothetical protein [Oscillospiraceae bacterium]
CKCKQADEKQTGLPLPGGEDAPVRETIGRQYFAAGGVLCTVRLLGISLAQSINSTILRQSVFRFFRRAAVTRMLRL